MSLVIQTEGGEISVPDSTLLAIAVAAAERVDGVHVLRRRSLDLDEPVVRLAVAARRGESLRALGEAAQADVASALQEMCGLDARVEITIAEFA